MNKIFLVFFVCLFVISYIQPILKSITNEEYKNLTKKDFIEDIRYIMLLAGAIGFMIGICFYSVMLELKLHF
jgi:hypothetical protein